MCQKVQKSKCSHGSRGRSGSWSPWTGEANRSRSDDLYVLVDIGNVVALRRIKPIAWEKAENRPLGQEEQGGKSHQGDGSRSCKDAQR